MRLLLLSAVASLTLHASGQEWSRFLGPDGSARGSAPGLPAEIKPETCAWRTDLPGTGVSSPIAWGDRIFLTAEISETGERVVLCYNLETGKEVWRYADKFDPHGKHKFNSFASSTPAADKERIYLAWSSGGIMRALALTHAGQRIWEKEVGPYKEGHGSGASPVLAGDVLVVSTDCEGGEGGIFGLKPSDGSVVWKHKRASDRTPFCTPLTYERAPGDWRIVVSSNPAGLTCLDAKRGKVVWEIDNPTSGLRSVGSPAMAGGVIFGAVGQGGTAKGSVAAKVTGDKAEKVWEGRKGMPYVPSPLALGDHFLFLGDGGILSSINAADGKPLWSERVFQSEQAYSTPVYTGDKIVCISRSGTITTVAADPKNFKILGTAKLDDTCDATPAIAGGKLIIRTAHKLMCVPGAKVQP
jgi:outer membrane protein assembly factor BamB